MEDGFYAQTAPGTDLGQEKNDAPCRTQHDWWILMGCVDGSWWSWNLHTETLIITEILIIYIYIYTHVWIDIYCIYIHSIEQCISCIPTEVCQEHVRMDLPGYIESRVFVFVLVCIDICIIQYYIELWYVHTHTPCPETQGCGFDSSFELIAQGFGPQTLRMERAAQCPYFECKPDAKGHGASVWNGVQMKICKGAKFLLPKLHHIATINNYAGFQDFRTFVAKSSLTPWASMKPCRIFQPLGEFQIWGCWCHQVSSGQESDIDCFQWTFQNK